MEPMTTAQLLECMDRHIKTCPDPTIVAMLKAMRSGIEAEFGIALVMGPGIRGEDFGAVGVVETSRGRVMIC